MKGWLLLVAAFLLWPGCSSQDACEEPEDVDFGEIVSTERAKYLENDQVQYKCNLGYVLEGPEWIQCQGQKWTPRPPKCLAPCSITRQQLATKNLFVFGSQRKARLVQSNQSLQFLCDEGYVLAVPSVRKCVDGYIELPLCISGGGKNCSGPPRIENGELLLYLRSNTDLALQWNSGAKAIMPWKGQKRSFVTMGPGQKCLFALIPVSQE
ncbi:complement factor H-related protein 1-like [Thamnophis elegans]|uniref:complement factor H-related protein 1-like n=1 Tax=Thamnophis elegans TaxID=35005 RepID=UPI00137696F3|nr:complement factor H-related protein 1-like [Thamnophis elegans]